MPVFKRPCRSLAGGVRFLHFGVEPLRRHLTVMQCLHHAICPERKMEGHGLVLLGKWRLGVGTLTTAQRSAHSLIDTAWVVVVNDLAAIVQPAAAKNR